MRFDSSLWRKCRIAFRCVRFGVWLAVLAVIGAFLWFNRVGLPDFLKARLVNTLHERGVELEFSRMRLSLVHGLVADDVRAGTDRTSDGAVFTARSVRLRLDFPALWHRRLQLDGLALHDGNFSLPLSPTNALTLTNLQTELRFGTDDTWSLDHFRANFAGAQINIRGELAHAPEVANWKFFNGGGTNRGASHASLKNFSDALQQIHFEGEPRLQLNLSGDARDIHSVSARLDVAAAAVQTPWFHARDFQASAQLATSENTPDNGGASWGFWTNLQPFHLAWSVRLGELRAEKLNADTLICDGEWSAPELAVTNFSARLDGGQWDASAMLNVATRQLDFTNRSNFDPRQLASWLPENARTNLAKIAWTLPPSLRAEGSLRLPPWTQVVDDWPAEVESSLQLRGELAATNFAVAGAALDRMQARFRYTNSVLSLTNLTLVQGRTQLAFSGQGDLATKNFQAAVSGQLDAASARPFLPPGNLINGFVALTTHAPLVLALDVRGNWQTLDDLTATGRVTLGRTRLELGAQGNAVTKNFHGAVSGRLDVEDARPFLTDSNAAEGFAIVTTSEPLALTLDARGNWLTLAGLTATGSVALTNFAVRGQTMDSVAARLAYADGSLQFLQPELRRAGGAQWMTGDAVIMDFKRMMMTFSNGFSIVDPVALTSAIGPKTAEHLEPYHFLKVPTARVNGCLPLRDMNGPDDMIGTDLRFDIVEDVPFQWLRLNSPGLKGTIHWLGGELVLTNLQAEFYGGTGTGDAYFDFRPEHEGADYRFAMTVTNVNLHEFAADVSSPTNHLEGTVAGDLVVTSADTRNLESWNGYGTIKLRDGLLWDIPLFGILSPVLNTLSAGLGNSRATEATANYTITNGIIHSDTLEIRSTMMRLSYTGTVDMEQNVNARVTAHLLRDVWVVGPLVSAVLWPVSKVFEYRVTGKLDDPQATPVFVPPILLAPLHPIRSLEKIFSPFSPGTNTNAPAAK
jgi:hypothetical protein